MERIIAVHLQQQEQVQRAITLLESAGFSTEKISAFYVNPAGQHDLYPIGGDRDDSPGAKESADGLRNGVAPGTIIGASVGMLGAPVAGVLAPAAGAAVGAYIGSLVGSLESMKERGAAEDGAGKGANTLPQRRSGMMVAVSVGDSDLTLEEHAIRILQSVGAKQIERAEGEITQKDWIDFDPLSSPVFLELDSSLIQASEDDYVETQSSDMQQRK